MQLSFGQETPCVANIRAEGIGTISRYVWYSELYPHVTCLLGPGKRNVLENQPADHLHHHGVCFSHGVVNDHLDFYLYREKRNLGKINVIGDVRMESHENVATLSHDSEWVTAEGKTLMADANFSSINIRPSCFASLRLPAVTYTKTWSATVPHPSRW